MHTFALWLGLKIRTLRFISSPVFPSHQKQKARMRVEGRSASARAKGCDEVRLLASFAQLSMSSAPSTALPSDLSKLNVSQLKAFCKQRRIVGYSKLGKAALICKLAELVPSAPPPISTQKTPSNTKNGSLFQF